MNTLNEIFSFLVELGRYRYFSEVTLTILVLALILWIWGRLRRRYGAIMLFSNEAGRVRVSRKALNDLVHSACFQVGAIERPKLSFKIRRRKLHIQLRMKLQSNQRLAELSTCLQDRLSDSLRDNLGVDRLGRIDILVTGFRGVPQTISRLAVADPRPFAGEASFSSVDSNDPYRAPRL